MLQNLANLAEIAGAITIIGGMVFGLMQLAEYRRQRRDSVAAELMRSFYSADFAASLAQVRRLPDGLGAAELRALDKDVEAAAHGAVPAVVCGMVPVAGGAAGGPQGRAYTRVPEVPHLGAALIEPACARRWLAARGISRGAPSQYTKPGRAAARFS